MRFLLQFPEFIRSSPTWIRDRSGLLSGYLVGLTALILNAGMLGMIALLIDSPSSFRRLLQTLDFGSLLGLLLCGGAIAAVTLLVPLRQTGLFLAPRIGRYFDQIVLSGISPMRYMAGTIVGQNLFFALILFLMLPWFALALSIGGMHITTFLGNLFLIWLFSMLLAVSTAALSLYLSEPLAFAAITAGSLILTLISILPIPLQPGLITPVPALLASVPQLMMATAPMLGSQLGYAEIFLLTTVCMSGGIVVGLLQLHFGPLFGLIRDNSAFGEVVHQGDNRLKRRFRFRLHIQRPSELAFFYQNRSHFLTRWEGLIRWGGSLLLLGTLAGFGCTLLFAGLRMIIISTSTAQAANAGYITAVVQAAYVAGQLGTAGTALLAVLLFSHNRSTFGMPVSVVPGIRLRVSTLDWASFLLVTGGTATTVSLILLDAAGPCQQQLSVAVGQSSDYIAQFGRISLKRWAVEPQLIVATAALTVYLLQRNFCLYFWSRLMAGFLTGFLWFFGMAIVPLVMGMMLHERAFRIEILDRNWELGLPLALLSPIMASIVRFAEGPYNLAWNRPLTGFYGLNIATWLVLGAVLFLRERRMKRVDDAWRAGRSGE
jgi:hypothetical protein